MKFGDQFAQFRRRTGQEVHAPAYLPYATMKQILRSEELTSLSSEVRSESLETLLRAELEMLAGYSLQCTEEIERRTEEIEHIESSFALVENLNACCIALLEFLDHNRVAASKIANKFDKHSSWRDSADGCTSGMLGPCQTAAFAWMTLSGVEGALPKRIRVVQCSLLERCAPDKRHLLQARQHNAVMPCDGNRATPDSLVRVDLLLERVQELKRQRLFSGLRWSRPQGSASSLCVYRLTLEPACGSPPSVIEPLQWQPSEAAIPVPNTAWQTEVPTSQTASKDRPAAYFARNA